MFSLSDRLPRYLCSSQHVMITVLAAVFFSLVFLLMSVPFSNNFWFALGAAQAFGFTVAFFFLSMAVVTVSKLSFVRYAENNIVTYGTYIVWCAMEVVVIALLYAGFSVYGNAIGLIDTAGRNFEELFLSSIVYVIISLGVPYCVMGLYFGIDDRDKTIRLMNMDGVVTDMVPDSREEKRITLFDNSGVLKFSVNQSNLYYIESDDNYVNVWYSDSSGQMKQYMLRCRLKTIEESFLDSDLVRCHRKYIVNISKVNTLESRKEGYFIDLDIDSLEPIPVSRTYEEAVLSRFNSR